MKRKVGAAEDRRGGQPPVPPRKKAVIAENLRVLKKRYRSDEAFARVLDVSRPTITSWFGKRPKTPGTAHVLAIAEKLFVQPTWLLLNEGPEARGATAPAQEIAEQIHGYVLGVLAAEAKANPEFVRTEVLPAPGEMLSSLLARYRSDVELAVSQERAFKRAVDLLDRQEIGGPEKGVLARALQIANQQKRSRRRVVPPVDPPGAPSEPMPELTIPGIPPLDPSKLGAAT